MANQPEKSVPPLPENVPPIAIIDNGSYQIRAGLAGKDQPNVQLYSVVGENRQADARPIQNGVVTNWDEMEKIWAKVLKDVRPESNEPIPVLITEIFNNPKPNKEKTAQIMFESFNVPRMSMVIQSVMGLYAAGKTNGIVVDSGYGVSHIVPIHHGYAVKDAIQKVEFGGRDVTKYLSTMLKEKHADVFASTDEATLLQIANDIKEKEGLVVPRSTKEMNPTSYALPDGKTIQVGDERFQCAEAIFNLSLCGKENMTGLHQTLYDTIFKCGVDMRRDLFASIVLAGGNTAFYGASDRFGEEVRLLAEPAMKVQVTRGPAPEYSAWIGGSILASMTDFNSVSVTKEQYEEQGAGVIHTKP